MKTYYPIPLHMHSVWERNASMEGHFYNAQKLGIHHMYLTDHDIRMGRKANHIDHFDFSQGKLRIDEPSPDPIRPRWHGFTSVQADNDTSCFVKDGALQLNASGQTEEWSTVRVMFDSSQKRQDYALLANLMLHLRMQIGEMDDNTRVIADLQLSQRPPAHLPAHLLYVFGNSTGLASLYTAVKPLSADTAVHLYDLPLLTDAASVGGGDNVLNRIFFSVSARRGKTAFLKLSDMRLTWDIAFEEGRAAQQKLANVLGKKYDVTPFVTTEITGAGHHKICFSSKVPILDYEKAGYHITDEQARAHVKKYGGIYAWNHPFEELKDRLTPDITPERKKEILDEYIRLFVQNRVWNATAMEVGFPMGRNAFTIEDHLALWDGISSAGIFITGYGDSDNHTNDTSWFDGNNFVAYIAADPPTEAGFIQGIQKGDVYTGDPVYLQKMQVLFTDSANRHMGQAVYTKNVQTASLTLSNVPPAARLVWTVNGHIVREESVSAAYTGSVTVPASERINFVRAALYKDDRCILLTNPIYYVADETIAIPEARL